MSLLEELATTWQSHYPSSKICVHFLKREHSSSVDDEVLYGVFVAGDPSSLRKELPLYRSALCIYPMADVEEVFKSNIMDCYQGIVLKQLPWFKSSDQCKATRLQWKDVACGKDVNANIGRQF